MYNERTIITAPPRRQRPNQPENITLNNNDATRKPIPISASPFGDPRIPGGTFIPRSGLDFLHGVPSIHIEQTISLLTGNQLYYSRVVLFLVYIYKYIHSKFIVLVHIFAEAETSENRFIVRSSTNEAIYSATEYSMYRDRILWGSVR